MLAQPLLQWRTLVSDAAERRNKDDLRSDGCAAGVDDDNATLDQGYDREIWHLTARYRCARIIGQPRQMG